MGAGVPDETHADDDQGYASYDEDRGVGED